jgi:hypothetical protein
MSGVKGRASERVKPCSSRHGQKQNKSIGTSEEGSLLRRTTRNEKSLESVDPYLA